LLLNTSSRFTKTNTTSTEYDLSASVQLSDASQQQHPSLSTPQPSPRSSFHMDNLASMSLGVRDFIVLSTQAQLNIFMSPNQPTRALLTLDIANMFNAISRLACRQALLHDNTLQQLLPFFDLLYHQHNRCWYQTPQGTYQQFPQEEGFT
jgi:hypothetical protein